MGTQDSRTPALTSVTSGDASGEWHCKHSPSKPQNVSNSLDMTCDMWLCATALPC
jgi:hypothetical protein